MMRPTSLVTFTFLAAPAAVVACSARQETNPTDSTSDVSGASEQSGPNIGVVNDANAEIEPTSDSGRESTSSVSQKSAPDAGEVERHTSETTGKAKSGDTGVRSSPDGGVTFPDTQTAHAAVNTTPELDAGTGGKNALVDASTAPMRWLAFQVEMVSDGSRPLFLHAVPSGPSVTLVAPNVAAFQWSADGNQLLFWTASVDGSTNGAYITTLDDHGFDEPTLVHQPLGEEARVKFAGLSPNGQMLALQVFEADTTRWYVRSIDAASDDWTLVGYGATGEHDPDASKFAWSPDGARAAIVEAEDDTYQRLLIVDSNGQWTDESYQDLFLVQWTHDSSALLVHGLNDDSLGTRSLALVDAESGIMTHTISDPATHSIGWDAFAMSKVAPSNSAVAFGANIGDEFDLFVRQVDGTEPAVMFDGRLVQQFGWFPDSERLYYWGYSHEDLDGPHLYSAPKIGGTLAKLNPADTFAHCNSADCIKRSGSSLVFTSLNTEQTANQLYDLDLSSASPTPRKLTNFREGVFVDYFSPHDTHEQVFTIVTSTEGEHELQLIDRGAESPEPRLVATMLAGAYPAAYADPWAPDARYFVFRANHDLDVTGNSDLFIGEFTTEGFRISQPVTSNDGSFYLSEPKWQP